MALLDIPNLDDIVDDALDFVGGIFDDINDLNLLDGLDQVFDNLGNVDLIDNIVGRTLFRGGVAGDVITGLLGNDILIGLLGNDTLIGRLGNDVLNGGKGNDLLQGLGGKDTLIGQFGKDILDGGSGNDILIGGKGLDELLGGNGRDTFVLELKNGLDTIKDYKDGSDRIKLPDTLDFDSLKITQTGSDTVISYRGNQLALLEDVRASRITGGDFVDFLRV